MDVEVEPQVLPTRADGEGGDRRHFVAPVPVMNHGRLAARRPRAPHGGNQLEARFISKDEVRVQSADFFLIPRQIGPVQSAMASSLRSSARRSGFWQDQPKSTKRRPTCVG